MRPCDAPKPLAFSMSSRDHLVLVDYAGHPFQAHLSRLLAAEFAAVSHLYCQSVASGQGNLAINDADPANLEFEGVGLSTRVERGMAGKRVWQELQWGWL